MVATRWRFEDKVDRRNVSLFLPDLRGGGAERAFLELAHEFSKMGHAVEFVLMQARGELLEDAHAHFPVIDLGASRAREVPRALARYLRQRRPDGLIAAIWPLTVLAPLARRLSGHRCQMLVSEHNTLSIQYGGKGAAHAVAMRASMAIGYRMADAVVGVSEGVVRDAGALSGMAPEQFRVIHNPVPPRPEPPAAAIMAADELWGVPAGRRILSVGSFKAQKNQALLLRAFARLSDAEARLMLLGNGKMEGELRRLAADLGIAGRVIFAGFRPDPTPFYMTADLFVLSSDYEGFGNVIVEALACGTPVVSTDCPSGPGEVLDKGRYGRLVRVGDVDALAHGMKDALIDTRDPAILTARAQDFAPAKAADRYLQLLFNQ